MAERYGQELADSLPEADAVLGFDDYPDIADRLRGILAGEAHVAHTPRDRRTLLPISPVDRAAGRLAPSLPGHAQSAPDLPPGVAPASGPRAVRRRLGSGPMAPLKLASGCDRRCSFCAIPSFRGSFVSRRPTEVARRGALAGRPRASASCSWSARTPRRTARTSATCGSSRPCCRSWPRSTGSSGFASPTCSRPRCGRPWSRRSRTTPGVAQYFDLSFQHASPTVLRRMRRFGDAERFLGLLDLIRSAQPAAGARSNVIVGFPGETEDDVQTLCDFLTDGPARRGRRLRLLRRGRHGGGRARRPPRRGRDPGPRRPRDAGSSTSSPRSAPRTGSASRSTCSLESVDGAVGEGRPDCQGPEVDGSTTVTNLPDGCRRSATSSPPSSPRLGCRPRRRAPDAIGWPPCPTIARPAAGPDDGSVGASGGHAPAPAVSNWNLPNALTTLRIVLVPLFAWLLLVDDGQDDDLPRLGVRASSPLAILTDRIDGDIARARNLVTDFGKLMDPIADKALTGMAFIGLSIIGELWWWVTILVLGREWGITLMRFWIIKYGVMPASRGGKIKTDAAGRRAVRLHPRRCATSSGALEHRRRRALVGMAALVMAAAVVVTVVTGFDYVREAMRLRREGQAAERAASDAGWTLDDVDAGTTGRPAPPACLAPRSAWPDARRRRSRSRPDWSRATLATVPGASTSCAAASRRTPSTSRPSCSASTRPCDRRARRLLAECAEAMASRRSAPPSAPTGRVATTGVAGPDPARRPSGRRGLRRRRRAGRRVSSRRARPSTGDSGPTTSRAGRRRSAC